MNSVYPRGQISVHLFYIKIIPILPILIYISTWNRLEIMASVSDGVSAARVVEQENSEVESCCLGAGERLHLLFFPNTVDKQI